MQVNSEHVSVAFLLPGGGTVRSEQRTRIQSVSMASTRVAAGNGRVCREDSPQTASSSPRGQSGTPLHTCDMLTQVRLSQEKPPTHGGIWSDPGGRTQL